MPLYKAMRIQLLILVPSDEPEENMMQEIEQVLIDAFPQMTEVVANLKERHAQIILNPNEEPEA